MTTLLTSLLSAGLFFPVISMLTGICSLVDKWRHKKHSSPVFIPFIGPFLLTSWVIIAHKPLWLIVIVWGADIGTVAFLARSPQLIREWWQTSSFTKILELKGSHDNQCAIITIHSTGYYVLKKSWIRPSGQVGIVGLGEPGTYTQQENRYELTSHVGLQRVLRYTDDRAYLVEEDELLKEELRNYSLNGWVLKP